MGSNSGGLAHTSRADPQVSPNMKNKHPKTLRPAPLSRALFLAFCATPLASVAQTAPAETPRIEITGSHIRRAEIETASPVQTITREDIEKSGKASIAEYLQTLAVDNQGSVPTTFGSGFASGGSGISLRGLGAASTLVLINGRRIAPYGLADDGQKVFADLNVLPLEAVERIEILKDGASAIYGSDAIAGVVNVILRRSFVGAVAKTTFGRSAYGDGQESRTSVTLGTGSLEKDNFNLLINAEIAHKGAIYNASRAGRGTVGRTDYRAEGFTAEASGGANGGTGAIIAGGGAATSSIVGNVRNPSTLLYSSRVAANSAACAKLAGSYPQGDPGGGCLIDAAQRYGMIQPESDTLNLFSRYTRKLGGDLEHYTELNYYTSDYRSQSTPSGVSGSTGYPGGPVANTGVALGASHPDNPYAGSAARLRYLAGDVGPRVSNVDSNFTRFLTGVKGSSGAWDFDSAVLFSESRTSNVRTGYLQRDVAFALLNPTTANVAAATANSAAYRALPAGTYWRIGENAGLNSAALYAALSPAISNDAVSRTTQLDFKASRELGKLEGGPIGLALGAEIRRESIVLEPTSGTDRGNIIGLGYSAYDGARTVMAAYGEALFPVTKQIELTAALRADHYDAGLGTSFTPKVGAKWKPASNFAMRATYAEGFRAPSAAENGKGGLAAFTSAADPARCNPPTITVGCSAGSVAIITSPNQNLKPEESKSMTLGTVWDVSRNTSVSADLWQIRRTNEINQESSEAAIAAGSVSRDPSTALPGVAGDPGAITAILARYVNSARTTVRGLDLDARHRIDFTGARLTLQATWTHLMKWERVEADGTRYEFAGTHGNCDVTNCIGTPKDRINLGASWDTSTWRLAAVANYRGALKNVLSKGEECHTHLDTAGTVNYPANCRIASFTTVDVSARYKLSRQTEVFGGIRNLFDRVPPLDPTTYGATGYNPLDYSGAVGRYYSLGMRHQF